VVVPVYNYDYSVSVQHFMSI